MDPCARADDVRHRRCTRPTAGRVERHAGDIGGQEHLPARDLSVGSATAGGKMARESAASPARQPVGDPGSC